MGQKRRRAALALLVGIAAGLSAPIGAQTKNNVLVIVADDLGVDYVGVYGEGSAPAKTPNIDALAKRGVLFRNAWANPSCSPSRACMMTGRYPFRTLVGRWIRYPNNSEPIGTLADHEWALPEVLDRAKSGHAHACIGKWHINDVTEGLDTPLERGGFSHFVGTMWGEIPDYHAWPRVAGGKETTSRNYATTQQTDDAIAWIRAQSGPWMCYLAYSAPHKPFHAPPQALHSENLTGLDPAKTPRPFYRAMIEALDTEIGRLLTTLGSQLANTDVVFVGDNGSVQQMAVAPFDPSRAKGTPYEGGLNVPLIVAGPVVASGGREVSALTCIVDVNATVIELCGATSGLPAWASTDGVSLVPYLRNPQQSALRKFAYSEEFTGGVWPKPNQNGHAVLRDDRYKLIYRVQGANEFYDLVVDPWERTNLLNRTLSSSEQAAHDAMINELGRLRGQAARVVRVGTTTCTSSRGSLTVEANGTPRIGNAFDVLLGSAPTSSPVAFALGFSSETYLGLGLPFDLRALGAPAGCHLYSSPDVLAGIVTNSTGSARVTIPVPPQLALVDRTFFTTWLVPDNGALLASDALACVLGN